MAPLTDAAAGSVQARATVLDTVGDLRRVLANLPDDMPITGRYDGVGRVTWSLSFIDPDRLGDLSSALLTIGPAEQAWLEYHGVGPNPALDRLAVHG